MTCMMVVSPQLVTALDPSRDVYLPPPTLGGTTVTCSIYPFSPATLATNPTLAIYNASGGQVGTPQINVMGSCPLVVSFTIGNLQGETAGGWNAIYITAQDSSGATTTFAPFYYYKQGGPPLGGGGGGPPGPPTKKKPKSKR